MAEPLVKLVDLSKYYSTNGVIALGLRNVNLELYLGEFVVITGASGSGKTTLLNVIAGMDNFQEGKFYFNGEDMTSLDQAEYAKYRRENICFVFQNYNLIESFNVYQNIELALTVKGQASGEVKAKINDIINRVGLGHRKYYRVSKLSGGEKQRVAIARAIASTAPIMACDEITGNLDSKTSQEIITLLKEVSKEKLVLLVTHDPEESIAYASKYIRLFDGEIVEEKEINRLDFKPTYEPNPRLKSRFFEVFKVSTRMLLRTPKKLIFMTLFFTFLLYFISFSANMIGSTLKLSQYQYFSTEFSNTYDQRVVIKKKNFTPFTEEEIDFISNSKQVNSVVTNDFVLENPLSIEFVSRYGYSYYYDLQLRVSDQLTNRDLIKGRLPQNSQEIVISVIDDQEFVDKYGDGIDQIIPFQFIGGVVDLKVVGITSQISSNYYHLAFVTNNFLKQYQEMAYFQNLEIHFNGDGRNDSYYSNPVTYLDELSPYDIIVINYYDMGIENYEYIGDVDIKSPIETITKKNLKIQYIYQDILYEEPKLDFIWYGKTTISIKESLLAEFGVYNEIYQVTANLDIDDIDKFVKEMEQNKNFIVYPLIYSKASYENIGEIFLNLFIKGFAILLIILVYVVGYFTFRSLMTTRRNDFMIVRSLGANNRWIRQQLNIELGLVMHFGLIVFGLLVLLVKMSKHTYLFTNLQEINLVSSLIIYSIALVLMLVLSFNYYRRLFKLSVVSKEVE